MTEIVDLPLDTIRTDGGTQSREHLDEEAVREYTAAYTRGDALPEPDVFFDGSDYWLAGGFHRYHGRRGAGFSDMPCRVHQGTRRDAVLFAAGENATHGIRRSNGDKRKAVAMLLGDEEWAAWSDREIARRCSVGHPLVAEVRASLSGSSSRCDKPETRKVRRGDQEYEQKRREHSPAAEESEPAGPEVCTPALPAAVGTAPISDATEPIDNPYLDYEPEPEPATPNTERRAKARQRCLDAVGVLVRGFDELSELGRFRQYLDVMHRFLMRLKP